MTDTSNYPSQPADKHTQDPLPQVVSNLRMASASLRLMLKNVTDSEATELCHQVEGAIERLDSLIAERKHNALAPVEIDEVSSRRRPQVSGESYTITYCSPAMHNVVEMAKRIAKYKVPVLIIGETGVGKELIARAVHLNSPRQNQPFIPFNCAAVPRELFESQLFGHKQGAFTGAHKEQAGVIRASASGTLLLDEIGELPLDLQPKLLRFLQEGEIHIVGDSGPARVNVRIIASTNRDLETEVAAGRFRADLFYRLNTICLHVPPLRERREDIPVLISFFLERNATDLKQDSIRFDPEALDRLVAYDWPGNVRELRNVLLRLSAFSDARAIISAADLPPQILRSSAQNAAASMFPAAAAGALPRVLGEYQQQGTVNNKSSPTLSSPGDLPAPSELTLAEAIDVLERQRVKEAMLRHNWNYAKAARHLGLSTFGLRKKYRRLFGWSEPPAGEAQDEPLTQSVAGD